jgi:hypothetical protein
MAGHLVELLAAADPSAHAVRARVYERRRDVERSTMSKGVFGWAARESSKHSGSD